MKLTQSLSSRFALILALLLGMVSPNIGWSQGSINGGLRGIVTDSTGAAVPGADLKLISLSTGAVHSQTASGTGEYSFTEIAPGNYRLSVTSKGFQRKDYTQITIILNETHELNVALDAGEVTTVVEVTGDASTVVSLDTSVGSIIDSKQILDLPLNGRDFQNLIILTPGAVRTASGENQGSGISAGGSRGTNNNYIIDGGDANDPRVPSGVAGASGGAVQDAAAAAGLAEDDIGADPRRRRLVPDLDEFQRIDAGLAALLRVERDRAMVIKVGPGHPDAVQLGADDADHARKAPVNTEKARLKPPYCRSAGSCPAARRPAPGPGPRTW